MPVPVECELRELPSLTFCTGFGSHYPRQCHTGSPFRARSQKQRFLETHTLALDWDLLCKRLFPYQQDPAF